MYCTISKNLFALTLVLSLFALGCKGGGDSAKKGASGEAAEPAGGGIVKIDGSSTVFPISEAVAEEYRTKSKTKVTIGVSGTGGGFKKFCAGELDITGASRYIKPTEKALCEKGGIEYIEIPVANDGISVVVNKANSFVDHLTVSELKTMWEPAAQGTVKKWNQIRSTFPDKELSLFGPGVDSGTFDYFTKKVVGKAQSSRGDYTASEDDNVLVHGTATNEGGLAFFGYAYYAENKNKLKVVPIKKGEGEPVVPTVATIGDGTYAPLSRPIFIYVARKSVERKEVDDFVKYFLSDGGPLAEEVGYIALDKAAADAANKRYSSRTVGSIKN